MARDMVVVMERLGFPRFSVAGHDRGVRVHAICEEYRAAASLDRVHDDADRTRGRRIACPLLALWSGRGALSSWYAEAGGPLALWRAWGDDVQGRALDAGHFFPEEIPNETADALDRFFGAAR